MVCPLQAKRSPALDVAQPFIAAAFPTAREGDLSISSQPRLLRGPTTLPGAWGSGQRAGAGVLRGAFQRVGRGGAGGAPKLHPAAAPPPGPASISI